MITHRISNGSLKDYDGENDKEPVLSRPEASDTKDDAEELKIQE